MSAESNIALVQNLYAAFGRGDLPTLLSSMSDDIDWGIEAENSTEVPWHGTGKGKKYASGFFEALAANCVFTRFEPSGFLASDTSVAALVTFEVTLKKNGRKSLNNVLHHFTIKDGKVAKWRGTEDTARTKAMWNS